MKVVITGGAGFVGLLLGQRLAALGKVTNSAGEEKAIGEIVLFDIALPDMKPQKLDKRIRFETGEVSDARTVRGLINQKDISIFHLASVLSALSSTSWFSWKRCAFANSALRAINCCSSSLTLRASGSRSSSMDLRASPNSEIAFCRSAEAPAERLLKSCAKADIATAEINRVKNLFIEIT